MPRSPQSINQGGKPPRPPRRFNGTVILIALFVLTAIAFIAAIIITQLRWNSLLTRVEPTDNWTQITKDLGSYWKQTHKLPEDLSEGEKMGWKWARDAAINNQAGALANGQTRNVSRVKFRQYEYMYARVSEDTAVMWAVPVWNFPPEALESRYLNAVTGHNEELAGYLEDLKKRKRTWFVVFYGNQIRAWAGVLPPQERATGGLEKNLEPTPADLQKNNLFEVFDEKWINAPKNNSGNSNNMRKQNGNGQSLK